MSVNIGTVRTFRGVSASKSQAVKVLEEAAEVLVYQTSKENPYQAGWWKCSACGGLSDAFIKGVSRPNFCGICGSAAVPDDD